MNGEREPFLAWPGWRHLKLAALAVFLGSAWFGVVYGGCDTITAARATRVRIHFDWELEIPFIPETVVVYMSIYLLFIAAPFILRERREFLALVLAFNLLVLAGGIGFLLVPARLAFPAATDLGTFPNLFRFADRLNLTYNLLPSLHVAFATLCVAAFARQAPCFGKCGLWVWAVAIALSTLLTHQHHVLDVVAGGLLAWAAYRSVLLRWSKS